VDPPIAGAPAWGAHAERHRPGLDISERGMQGTAQFMGDAGPLLAGPGPVDREAVQRELGAPGTWAGTQSGGTSATGPYTETIHEPALHRGAALMPAERGDDP
jgi:hypothetical protein